MFVMQLEGQKRWRVHGPTDPNHVLPRCAPMCTHMPCAERRAQSYAPTMPLPIGMHAPAPMLSCRASSHRITPHRIALHCAALCRFSSRDFLQEELGETVLDVVLLPGDMLYLPRGSGELPRSCRVLLPVAGTTYCPLGTLSSQ